ncbi:GGDEF domain-containing protein [Mesobacillus subterraneus]|uniref:GGDEF domain-containing protein n=1 Tax=Mesobacillus subterraneus TaxID=285983 RepID=UPI00203A9D46|nr:GGDEF domain-containing protein [Mesobacillus subterraneus]MCM3665207.1 GGDEF domain-containing protein [Mesobacillus subterraneus]MCM3684220.1 GGDEF domain-containing protein [Mesobacillus subterraneus]
MFKKFDTIDELKRIVYMWLLPIITIALVINSFLNNESLFDTIVNTTLIFWFSVSWFLVYLNLAIRFGEYSNLLLVSLYHVTTLFDVVHNDLAKTGGSLGDFIVWIPLIIMFFFLVLGTKRGLYFSIIIFSITLGIGLMYSGKMPPESIDSLTQFHAANIVYILVLFYAQNIFKAFTERDFFKKHAYIDSLTRVANRHQIDVWLEEKLEDADEDEIPFSIIFFDIDHFKKVNDQYGHKIGDCVLKELSATISGNLSEGDLFGRWGGEEFILINNCTGGQAYEKAEQLRKLVENKTFKGAGSLTASFGVTDYQPGDNIDSLLNRADKGLYTSKNSGRNKVSMN